MDEMTTKTTLIATKKNEALAHLREAQKSNVFEEARFNELIANPDLLLDVAGPAFVMRNKRTRNSGSAAERMAAAAAAGAVKREKRTAEQLRNPDVKLAIAALRVKKEAETRVAELQRLIQSKTEEVQRQLNNVKQNVADKLALLTPVQLQTWIDDATLSLDKIPSNMVDLPDLKSIVDILKVKKQLTDRLDSLKRLVAEKKEQAVGMLTGIFDKATALKELVKDPMKLLSPPGSIPGLPTDLLNDPKITGIKSVLQGGLCDCVWIDFRLICV